MKTLLSLLLISALQSAVTSKEIHLDAKQGHSEENPIYQSPSDPSAEEKAIDQGGVHIAKVVPAHVTVHGRSVKISHGIRREDEEEQGLFRKSSAFCELDHQLLVCDFKGKKLVRVKDLPADEHIEKLIVRNALEIILSGSVCFNLILEDIGSVKVEGRLTSDCPGGKLLVLKNATLNRLPEAVNSVYAISSYIEEIVLHNITDMFLVKKSKVGTLSVSTALKNEVEVIINQTEIDLVEKLRVGDLSTLYLSNCTFGNIRKHAIILGSGKNVVREVISKHSSSAAPIIDLRGEAEVILTDLVGSVNIVNKPCPPTSPQTPCSLPTDVDVSSGPSAVNFEKEKSEEGGSTPLCVIIHNGKSFENCQMLVILFTFSVFLNILQLLFNQPRELLMKIFHIESPASEPSSPSAKRESIESDGEGVDILQDKSITGRKRGTSLPGHILTDVENGDPFASEVQMVDERHPRTYRHSLSLDETGKEEAETLLKGSESKKCLLVPRRRIRSSNGS